MNEIHKPLEHHCHCTRKRRQSTTNEKKQMSTAGLDYYENEYEYEIYDDVL